MIERLISLIAPHCCVRCGAEGELVCSWCRLETIPSLPSRCYHCKKLIDESKVCQDCRRSSPLKHVWVRTVYSGMPKELVHVMKFERAQAAPRLVAGLLLEALPAFPPDVLVSYIPTATSRVRVRGYDQSRLIARYLAREQKLLFGTTLLRQGQSRQVGSSKKQRLEQAQRSYKAVHAKRYQGKDILLIDDIITTGATLEAAARELRRAGARTVYAAVFAQKQ